MKSSVTKPAAAVEQCQVKSRKRSMFRVLGIYNFDETTRCQNVGS